jgi:hypothetical protein
MSLRLTVNDGCGKKYVTSLRTVGLGLCGATLTLSDNKRRISFFSYDDSSIVIMPPRKKKSVLTVSLQEKIHTVSSFFEYRCLPINKRQTNTGQASQKAILTVNLNSEQARPLMTIHQTRKVSYFSNCSFGIFSDDGCRFTMSQRRW